MQSAQEIDSRLVKETNVISSFQVIVNHDLSLLAYVQETLKQRYAKPMKAIIELNKIRAAVCADNKNLGEKLAFDDKLQDFIRKHKLEEYMTNVKVVDLDYTNRRVERATKKN